MAGQEQIANAGPYPAQPISLEEKSVIQRSMLADAARRFSRNRLAMLGLLIVLCLLFLTVSADVIAPYPYDAVYYNIVNELPFVDSAHILGGDNVGRDYLSRLIYGARTSMLVGLTVPIVSFAIGLTLGGTSGYTGGAADFFIQRLVDVMTAIPPLLFALFLLSITGSGVGNVIFVLGVTGWVEPTRLTRAQFLAFREREFVMAARSMGVPQWRIALLHILPNAIAPLLVSFTFAIPLAIFSEAGLSFLGIGITEPTASWGKMVGSQMGAQIRVYYHLALFPTILVALTMLGFSFVGDGLQEALDPGRTR